MAAVAEQTCVESVLESAEGGRERRKLAAGCARSFTVAQQWQGADHQAAVPWKQISGVYGHEEERVPGRGRPRGARWGGWWPAPCCFVVGEISQLLYRKIYFGMQI